MCEKIRWPWSLPRQPWCWPHWLAWHPLAPNSFGRKVIWTWEGRNPQWCQSKSRLKVHKITLYPGPFLWAQDAWGVWELTWGMQLFALPQGHSLCLGLSTEVKLLLLQCQLVACVLFQRPEGDIFSHEQTIFHQHVSRIETSSKYSRISQSLPTLSGLSPTRTVTADWRAEFQDNQLNFYRCGRKSLII